MKISGVRYDVLGSDMILAAVLESSEDSSMRKVISEQSFLGSIDIPVLLIGLQAIYMDEGTRPELFHVLDEQPLPDRRQDTGRPGWICGGFW